MAETKNNESAVQESEISVEFPTREIAVDLIDRNADQPRRYFDQAALAELAASIKENGILQPITVRPADDDHDGDGQYVIVMGERRWRASKAAGLKTIPAIVRDDLDPMEAFVLAVSENINREDMTILEEAGAFADLRAAGWGSVQIAKRFGKTETHVNWRLGLLTLCEEVGKLVNEGKIKPNLAWHIAQLSPNYQLIVAHRYLRGDFETEQHATHFAQGLRLQESQMAMVTETAPNPKQEKEKKEAREAAQIKQKETGDKLAAIDEHVMPLMNELLGQKIEDLAVILGPQAERYAMAMERLLRTVQAARLHMSKVKGAVEAQAAVAAAAAPTGEARDEDKAAPAAPAKKATAKPAAPAKKTAGTAAKKPGGVPAQGQARAAKAIPAKPAPAKK